MPRPLVALLLAFALPALAAETASGDIAARTARWHLTPRPEARAAVGYEATFTRAELERIARGFEPESMDDKWVIVADGDRVAFHRSWTGDCIFELRLEPTKDGARVASSWVSRGGGYASAGIEDDRRTLDALVRNFLLAPQR